MNKIVFFSNFWSEAFLSLASRKSHSELPPKLQRLYGIKTVSTFKNLSLGLHVYSFTQTYILKEVSFLKSSNKTISKRSKSGVFVQWVLKRLNKGNSFRRQHIFWVRSKTRTYGTLRNFTKTTPNVASNPKLRVLT